MQEEMEPLHRNGIWDLVTLPKGKNVVYCKWVFKRKEGIPGVEETAKGYDQIPCVDFTYVFSLVLKHSSIQTLLSIMAMHDFELQ